QLAEWGLGVALDRDEQVERSRRSIALALEHDPAMSRLSDESVFFEPPGDKHYYLALGHEAAGDVAEARAALRAFLAEVPGSRYAARARAHLRRLPPGPEPIAGEVRVGPAVTLRAARAPEAIRATFDRRAAELRLCDARARRADPGLH